SCCHENHSTQFPTRRCADRQRELFRLVLVLSLVLVFSVVLVLSLSSSLSRPLSPYLSVHCFRSVFLVFQPFLYLSLIPSPSHSHFLLLYVSTSLFISLSLS